MKNDTNIATTLEYLKHTLPDQVTRSSLIRVVLFRLMANLSEAGHLSSQTMPEQLEVVLETAKQFCGEPTGESIHTDAVIKKGIEETSNLINLLNSEDEKPFISNN